MKNKRINRLLATTMATAIFATSLVTSVNALGVTDSAMNSSVVAKVNSQGDIKESNSLIPQEKIDEYRETYILMNGSDEGFNENEIQANANLLESLGENSNLDSKSSRKQLVDKYFNSVKWITKSNGDIALSISPTQQFLNMHIHGTSSLYSAAITESWGIIQRNYSNDKRWKNGECLRLQYMCHCWHAQNKTPWNLETRRTSTNYAHIVANACNPEN